MARNISCLLYTSQSVATNGAYNYAGTQGIPGILIERGECGYWKQTEVELFKKDIRNVLRHLQFCLLYTSRCV